MSKKREPFHQIAIIFDMDGTLLDSSDGITNSVNYVRSTLKLPPVKKELILKHINTPGENLAQRFYGMPTYDNHIKEVFGKHYIDECVKHVKLYDGIQEMLDFLHPRAFLGVATNAYDLFAKKILEHCKIGHYFDMIVGANSLNSSKPEPTMLEFIMKNCNVKKEHTLLIGDSQKDELAAFNAHTSFIYVNWGYGEYQPINSFTCKNSTKLLETIFEVFPALKA